jgi:hypothetical protein
MSEPCGPSAPEGKGTDTRGRARVQKGPTLICRIESWLRQLPEQCFCYDCIALGISVFNRTMIMAATNRLTERGACSRYRGKCAGCGKVTQVAVARRL